MTIRVQRWGIQIGRLHITWWDFWAKRPCFEIVWERATCWDLWERDLRNSERT